VERRHGQLRESLQALVSSEDWQQALAVAARFHDYSFANIQLISGSLTRPSSESGGRLSDMADLGRQVRRGERGLAILAPIIRQVEVTNSKEERRVVRFRVVNVFDQSLCGRIALSNS